MSETPKCPGCGSEMKAIDFGREYLNFSFFCYECGWGSPLRDTAEEAISAALRRAEPKNRPMMLKEVKAHCTKGPDAEPLWVEFREKCTIPRWSFATIAPGVFDRPVLSEWIATGRSKEYGKVWRCWPRKPTPEQMTAEKWEE